MTLSSFKFYPTKSSGDPQKPAPPFRPDVAEKKTSPSLNNPSNVPVVNINIVLFSSLVSCSKLSMKSELCVALPTVFLEIVFPMHCQNNLQSWAGCDLQSHNDNAVISIHLWTKVISRSPIDKLYLCCKTGGNFWGCPQVGATPSPSSYYWGCPTSTPKPTGTIIITCMLRTQMVNVRTGSNICCTVVCCLVSLIV